MHKKELSNLFNRKKGRIKRVIDPQKDAAIQSLVRGLVESVKKDLKAGKKTTIQEKIKEKMSE